MSAGLDLVDSHPVTAPEASAEVVRPEWTESLGAMLPPALEAWLRRKASGVMPLLPRRIPLSVFAGTGSNSGQALRVLVAGPERACIYWLERLFAAPPRREFAATTKPARLRSVLADLRANVDVTIVFSDRASLRAVAGDDYLLVPEWVGTRAPVPADVTALARSSNSLADDLRRIRHAKLVPEIARGEADFDAFYREMYLPHLRNRLGAQSHIHSRRRLHRSFRRGGLLWAVRDGERVAGNLFERDGNTLHSVAFGVANGNEDLLRLGAGAALYMYLMAYARSEGFATVDFRGNRPSLHDGLLRYKRKWGARLYARRDALQAFLFHWPRSSTAVTTLLCGTSLIAEHDGALHGVAALDGTIATPMAAERACEIMWVPGLRGLFLVGAACAPSGASTFVVQDTSQASGSAAVVAAMRDAARNRGRDATKPGIT